MKVILSSIGTSLLTKKADEAFRNEIIDFSNKKEHEIPVQFKNRIEELKTTLIKTLLTGDDGIAKSYSAELNGILSYYDKYNDSASDIHLLIGTDTFLAAVTMDIVSQYIKEKGHQCISYSVPELNTESKSNFDKGIKNLLEYLDNTIPEYRESRYEVIFNLTGGFKSLQGFLNTFGTFYADRIVYIFESGGLIEIPKLPVSIDKYLFKQNALLFTLLGNDHYQPKDKISNLPQTLFLELWDHVYGLSNWGLLSWNNIKSEVLTDDLLILPNIQYEQSFKEDFQKLTDKRKKVEIQELLASISLILSTGGVQKLSSGGIQLTPYSGNTSIYHFRVNQQMRITCTKDGNILILRHYGTHDYTERKENVS
ncbi:MAG: hypothetical protein LC128_10245 [Chitinophagales bacterium]|nr:hypothetical protein [Chitinophagales bacterium]